MRTLIVGSVVLVSLAGLLVFASEGRSQDGRRFGRNGRGDRAAAVRIPGAEFAALPASVKAPADNPTTPDKVALGRLLFWDPVLSGRQDVACGTCHHPQFGYAENRDISIGVTGIGLGASRHFMHDGTTQNGAVPFVKRNSQTILNAAFNGIGGGGAYDPSTAPMFWDLRAKGLEAQALEPIKTLEEMRGDASAMSTAAINGMRRFERVGCINCHHGPMFSDYQVHVLGVPDNPRLPASDSGVDQQYAFRTASLRNLTVTAPYMHSGVFDSLRDVLEFYDDVSGRRGGARNSHVSREQLDPLVRQLRDPDARAGELLAFLEALTDDTFDRTIPATVPSGLTPGGNIN